MSRDFSKTLLQIILFSENIKLYVKCENFKKKSLFDQQQLNGNSDIVYYSLVMSFHQKFDEIIIPSNVDASYWSRRWWNQKESVWLWTKNKGVTFESY